MNTNYEISKDFLSSLQWIRLDDLFNLPYDELPQWVLTSNVVYYCRNTHNDKGYVGETKQSLVDRWRGTKLMNHQNSINISDNIIYRALRKYTPNKFILSIVQNNFESDNSRKQAEIYWINILHTYKTEWGYNMTLGGNSTSQLRIASIKRYPSTNGMPPECIEAGKRAMNELYHMNGMSPQCLKASLGVRLRKYPETNGCPPQNTKSMHEANLKYWPETNGASKEFIEAGHRAACKLFPDTNGMNPDAIKNSVLSRIIKYINKNIDQLKHNDLPLTYENYMSIGDHWTKCIHIKRLSKWINELRNNPQWSQEMEEIFKNIKSN